MSEIPKPPQGPRDNEAVGHSEIEKFRAAAMSLLREPVTDAELTQEMNEDFELKEGQELHEPTKDAHHVWNDEYMLPNGIFIYVQAPEPGFDDFEFPDQDNIIKITVAKPPTDNPDGTQTYPVESFILNLFREVPDLEYEDETFLRDEDGKRISRTQKYKTAAELASFLISNQKFTDQLGLRTVTQAKFRELTELLEQIK